MNNETPVSQLLYGPLHTDGGGFDALGYLALYPGLGNYTGLLGWTSTNQLGTKVAEADGK